LARVLGNLHLWNSYWQTWSPEEEESFEDEPIEVQDLGMPKMSELEKKQALKNEAAAILARVEEMTRPFAIYDADGPAKRKTGLKGGFVSQTGRSIETLVLFVLTHHA
jgi:hypothetical protein